MEILTEKELKKRDLIYKEAKPKDKDYTINDGDGLYMKITKDNKKLWHFRYSFNNKRYLTSFQSYPKVTLKEARIKKNEYLALLKQGINPIEHFKKQKLKLEIDQKGLFENVFYEWLEYEKKRLAPPTFKTKKQIFISSVLPYFKNKNIKDITKNELLKVIQDKEKTAKETASRLIGYIIDLYSYAISRDYCEINYLKNIDKKYILKEKRRVKNYSKITDIPTFKELVNEIYNADNLFFSMQNLLKLSLHIPLRANNICNLKWENINFENKTLTIAREQMKIKNPNLNDFSLPLSSEVINILLNQKEKITELGINSEYIFIGTDFIKPLHKDSPTKALIYLGFTKDKKQSLHSMRGSFKTILEEKEDEHNISDKIIKSVLDHTLDNKVGLAYSNKINLLHRQKPLLDFWSDFIVSLRD